MIKPRLPLRIPQLSMALSLKRFTLKAPLPRVVLLPDALFFVRVVPVTADATPAEISGQVELALESLAPFPLTQLYHGHYWAAGASTALIFAAYRKRFTDEQTESWAEAEMVLPVFTTVLTATVNPLTALVLNSEEGVTAICWGQSTLIPSAVLTRSWPPGTEPSERQRVHDEVLFSLRSTYSVVELNEVPAIETDGKGGEFVFRAGPITAPFDREQVEALDVRGKAELLGRRNARARDLYLWCGFLTCAAALCLAAPLEVGLIGGRLWQ